MLPSISGGTSKPASESAVGARSMPLTSSSLTTPASMCRASAQCRVCECRRRTGIVCRGYARAVIGDEEDDGVVGDPFVFEALEHLADFAVKDLSAFEIHGPIFSDEG